MTPSLRKFSFSEKETKNTEIPPLFFFQKKEAKNNGGNPQK